MKLTILFERPPLKGTATAEVGLEVITGNGYTHHTTTLAPGEAGGVTFTIPEVAPGQKFSVHLSTEGIT